MSVPSSDRSYWIIIERYENWLVDSAEGFVQFGLPARKEKLAQEIRPGDFLLGYVSSGISAFADVREVVGQELQKLRHGGNYDTAFPVALKTKPITVVSKKHWPKIKEIAHKLTFTRGRDYRQLLRTSVKRIGREDGEIIVAAITMAAAAEASTS